MSADDDDFIVDADYIDENENYTEKKDVKSKSIGDNQVEEITISKQEYDNLKNGIINEKNRYDELYDKFQRIQADIDNYKKYLDKEKISNINYASGQLIKKLLDVLDNFERAFASINIKKGDTFIEGLESIYNDFYSILEKEGLKPIKCLRKFDPYKQECLLTEDRDDLEEDDIIEILSKGYMFKDKVLRPAMVKIAKKKVEPREDINIDVNKKD